MTENQASTDRPSPRGDLAEVGRRRMLLLGILGAVKALGLVLVADALATGVVTVIHHGDVGVAVMEGVAGALLRAGAVWGLGVASQATAAGVKQGLRARLAATWLRSSDQSASADDGADGADATRRNVGSDAVLATSGLDDLDAYYTSYLPALVSAATVPLLVGVRILAADWISALVIVITIPLIPLFMALIGMHTRDRVAASLDAMGRLSDHLVELARGLPVLVGLGRDREQTAALRDISDDHRRRSMTALRTAFLSALALDLLATISVALVAVVIGVRLLHGQLGLEAGLVALILAPECYAPLREIGSAFHASDLGREALRRARRALGLRPAEHEATRTTGAGVVVRDLSVTYAERTAPAVSHLSFEAPTGRITLLAGTSGAGKSTVLAVLAGRGALLDAGARVSGTIVLPEAVEVAWMPQHPSFASATVVEEVALYGPQTHEEATQAGAVEAAMGILDRVGLTAFAHEDPATLSPGEARRLAFSRVLAAVDAGARLVLLDEPTAHLDEASAAIVRSGIRSLADHAAVVVASHDARLQALADAVVPVVAGEPASLAQFRTTGAEERSPLAAGPSAPRVSAPPSPAGEVTARDHEGNAWREFVAFVRPVRWRMLAAVFVGLLSSAFAVALIAVSGWLIVRASQEVAIMYLLVAIVGVRFFGVGRSALRYAERLLTHDAVFRALTAMRVRLWRGLAANGPAGRAALSPANALAALVGAADRVRDLVPRVVQPPLVALLMTVAATVALGMLYPPAMLVTVAMAVLALLVAPAVAVVASRMAAGRGERDRAAVLRAVTDLLVARDDLTERAGARVLRRLRSADAAAAASQRRTAFVEGAASALAVAACCAAAVAMLPLAAGAVASGALRPELVAVLTLVPLSLVEPMLDGVAAASRMPALARVLAEVDATASLAPAETTATFGSATGDAPSVAGILLDGVSYRYPDAPTPAFTGVGFGVERGEWLAVTGPSGSGKSTLLGVLLRFLEPDAGSYLVRTDDAALVDAEAIAPEVVRSRIAWCPQEGHLFDSTLRANLVLARGRDDRPSDDELTDALARVGLAELVAQLPRGLDTRIGASGSRLSGGQRQRVAVARTLLAGGDVVLVDEPTAQLDEEASASLMADLREALRDRVAVLVTHDRAEADAADHVLVLDRRHGDARTTAGVLAGV